MLHITESVDCMGSKHLFRSHLCSKWLNGKVFLAVKYHRKWILNSEKVPQLGLLLKNKNVGGELRSKRGAVDVQKMWSEMYSCEQEPPIFPLLQIVGLEGKLKEEFQRIPEKQGMFCKDEGYTLCACPLCVRCKDGRGLRGAMNLSGN